MERLYVVRHTLRSNGAALRDDLARKINLHNATVRLRITVQDIFSQLPADFRLDFHRTPFPNSG